MYVVHPIDFSFLQQPDLCGMQSLVSGYVIDT